MHKLNTVARLLCLLLALAVTPAIAREHGAVTAVASLGSKAAAFVGFSSGAVLYCARLGGCSVLEGTPPVAVTAVDTPRGGDVVQAWVGYADGSVYFCTLTGDCIRQELQETGPAAR